MVSQPFPRREREAGREKGRKGWMEGGRELEPGSRRLPEEEGTLPLHCIHFPDLYSDSGFLLITMKKKNHHLHLKRCKPGAGVM